MDPVTTLLARTSRTSVRISALMLTSVRSDRRRVFTKRLRHGPGVPPAGASIRIECDAAFSSLFSLGSQAALSSFTYGMPSTSSLRALAAMRVQLRFNEAIADVERNSFLGSVGITPKAPYHIALRRHLWPPALEGPLFSLTSLGLGGLCTTLRLSPAVGIKTSQQIYRHW